ncbi:hypothetical protein LTR50_000891 [Elasticomyces elasticus]|nr:hypothetical protein LTR50_000891 [Elasticomyces elasticus]
MFLLPCETGSTLSYLSLNGLADDVATFGIDSLFMKRPEEWNTGRQGFAAACVEEIRRRQPQGPYTLAGWSYGGAVALEASLQLITAGEAVEDLILVDAPYPESNPLQPLDLHEWFVTQGFYTGGASRAPSWLQQHIVAFLSSMSAVVPEPRKGVLLPRATLILAEDGICGAPTDLRLDDHEQVIQHPVARFLLLDRVRKGYYGWEALSGEAKMDVAFVTGNHFSMLQQPHASQVSEIIRCILQNQQFTLPSAEAHHHPADI